MRNKVRSLIKGAMWQRPVPVTADISTTPAGVFTVPHLWQSQNIADYKTPRLNHRDWDTVTAAAKEDTNTDTSVMRGLTDSILPSTAQEYDSRAECEFCLVVFLPSSRKNRFHSKQCRYAAAKRRAKQKWQDDLNFINALKYARQGDGKTATDLLYDHVTWSDCIDDNFDGTTIMAKNNEVDYYNSRRFAALPGKQWSYGQSPTSRWGKQRREWDIIPSCLSLKDGAYVMILTNDPPEFTFANGDCGYIVECGNYGVTVRLKRNGNEVRIEPIWRYVESVYAPDGCKSKCDRGPNGEYYDSEKERWISIRYLPVRLAYASTVHKSQGLTLDTAQLCIGDDFFSSPNMGYVALSRTRTTQGLRIVGNPAMLQARINVHPEVKPWI